MAAKIVTLTCSVLVLLSVCLLAGVHAGKYDEKNGRHNIAMGHVSDRDILLFHDSLEISGTLFPYPKVKSHDVCYPDKKSHHHPDVVIRAFNVTDLGKGGYAFVKEGGIGWGKLCLHLKTQRGKGYHFNIDIWGNPLYK